MRRRLLLASALLLLPALTPGAMASGPVYKETSWDDLMPRDWDPMKELRAGDNAPVLEGSFKEHQLMQRMREIWDRAPVNPKMEGVRVRLPGYVVPLEEAGGGLKEFLLVPYFGACIHSPPPPANQIVHVTSKTPLKGWRTMDAVSVTGTLRSARAETSMGATGYRIADPVVERYIASPRQ